jgi:hypothetical protein
VGLCVAGRASTRDRAYLPAKVGGQGGTSFEQATNRTGCVVIRLPGRCVGELIAFRFWAAGSGWRPPPGSGDMLLDRPAGADWRRFFAVLSLATGDLWSIIAWYLFCATRLS